MKNHHFSVATALLAAGVSVAATGCILGSDPNKNSRLLFDDAGASGGVSGGGGAGGAGMLGAIIGSPLATFDSSSESFAFSMYDEPTNLALHSDAGSPASIMADTTEGSPNAGSLKVYAPYSGANQYVDVQSKAYMAGNFQNFMGGKIHVRVKVDDGSTFKGQIEPYVDTTTTYAFVGSSLNVIASAGYHDYVVDLNTAVTQISGFDLKQVILFGVHIGSGSAGATQGPVTFHIDSFSIEGVTLPTVDAGSDAAAAVDDAGSDAASGN